MLYKKQFSLIYRIIIVCLFRMLDGAYFNSEICYLQALKRLNIRSKVRNVDTLHAGALWSQSVITRSWHSVDMKGIAHMISKWKCNGFENFGNTTSCEEKGNVRFLFFIEKNIFTLFKVIFSI